MSKARQLAQKPSQPTGRKNLVINGAMQVAQRGTNVSDAITYQTVDRFRQLVTDSAAAWTMKQLDISDNSNNAPEGFSHSYELSIDTAATLSNAGDHIILQHKIEGQNLQHLQHGTSEAKAVTLSFWVRSSKTGTASVNMETDSPADPQTYRLYNTTYTINTADTWEYKTVTFPGDTGGDGIINTNGAGVNIFWMLNSGTTYTSGSTTNAWATYDNANVNINNLDWGKTVGDTFRITGVQLEVGSTATEFEHLSYGEELDLCQRYYQQIDHASTQTISYGHTQTVNRGRTTIPITKPMRDLPSISTTGNYKCVEGDNTTTDATDWTAEAMQGSHVMANITVSGISSGAHVVYAYAGILKMNAEL